MHEKIPHSGSFNLLEYIPKHILVDKKKVYICSIYKNVKDLTDQLNVDYEVLTKDWELMYVLSESILLKEVDSYHNFPRVLYAHESIVCLAQVSSNPLVSRGVYLKL